MLIFDFRKRSRHRFLACATSRHRFCPAHSPGDQLEDEFLKQNLPGYNDYAKKVPSRLPRHPTVGRIALKGWVCCRVGGRCAE